MRTVCFVALLQDILEEHFKAKNKVVVLPQKGLKQGFDAQCGALLHPYYTLMFNLTK